MQFVAEKVDPLAPGTLHSKIDLCPGLSLGITDCCASDAVEYDDGGIRANFRRSPRKIIQRQSLDVLERKGGFPI